MMCKREMEGQNDVAAVVESSGATYLAEGENGLEERVVLQWLNRVIKTSLNRQRIKIP